MRLLRKLRLLSPLIVVFALSACVNCYAQTKSNTTAGQLHASPAQDSETLKQLEITSIRLAAANEKITLLEQRLSEKDAIADALRGNITVKDEMIGLLKSANQDRATVNTGDARMLAACDAQLGKAEARIHSLEHPGLLRSIFDPRALTGFGAGYGARSIEQVFKK